MDHGSSTMAMCITCKLHCHTMYFGVIHYVYIMHLFMAFVVWRAVMVLNYLMIISTSVVVAHFRTVSHVIFLRKGE